MAHIPSSQGAAASSGNVQQNISIPSDQDPAVKPRDYDVEKAEVLSNGTIIQACDTSFRVLQARLPDWMKQIQRAKALLVGLGTLYGNLSSRL